MAISKGTRLGEYVLIERLGSGGFGEVWKAYNPDLDDEFVAIKIPTHPDAINELGKEGRLQKRLQHPNIVETRSANLSNNPPYVVFEFVDAVPLNQVLEELDKMTIDRVLPIARGILHALEYAHGKGVIHGDVKPSNILVDSATGEVKITDFGMGRILNVVSESIQLSGPKDLDQFNRIQGSLRYMAPEIEKGELHSKRADVYAMGIVLHEMLTGDATHLRFPVEGAPEWLSDVIGKAVEPDPGDRYGSAGEMLEAFSRDKGSGNVSAKITAPPQVKAPSGGAADEMDCKDVRISWDGFECIFPTVNFCHDNLSLLREDDLIEINWVVIGSGTPLIPLIMYRY